MSIANTVLLEARQWISENAESKFERRKQLTEIMPIFLAGSNYIPDMAAIKSATTQATSIMYKQSKAFTMNSSKSNTPSGENGSTAKVALTWAQKGFTVKHFTKPYAGNELTAMAAFAYNLDEAEKQFWFGNTGMDAAMLAFLEANISQVNAADGAGVGIWKGTPDFFMETTLADKSVFYNNLLAQMAINNYSDTVHIVSNTAFLASDAYYAAQGTANSVNTAFQFDGTIRHKSNLITPDSGYGSKHYVVPTGGVAMLDWNEPINREGKDTGINTWGVYQSKYFPGVTFDMFAVRAVSDTTALGGDVQDLTIDYEFTLNYSLIKQPLSNASGETTIFKQAIKNT